MKKEKKSSYNNYVPKSAKRCKNPGLILSTQKKRKMCQKEQKKYQKMCKKCLKLNTKLEKIFKKKFKKNEDLQQQESAKK